MYVWNSKKPKKAIHIINPETNRTYCKAENSVFGKCTHLERGETKPEGRRLCSICVQVQANGTKPENNPRDFYQSRDWHKLRYQAFKKYGSRCMVCGGDKKNGVRIHVDHIKPVRKYPELALDINNLQILCALCNSGKGSWDETDWRDEPELTAEQDSHIKKILNS